MDAQTEIRLTNVNVASQQDIDLLIEAANDIQNATETNFMHMKEKKWYKRLWEIATFSKDNIKVIAKNTVSLAQMQDIILKVILMVSKESRELSKYLVAHSEQLENMAKGQVKLANAIAKIKYGHDQRPDINDMPTEYQYVIVSTALKFVDEVCGGQDVSHSVQQYLRNLRNCCGILLNPEVSEFDYGKINNLNADGHKLLAVIICEAAVLLDDNMATAAAFDEVVRYIGISSIVLEGIKGRAAEYARIMGKEFITAYYDKNAAFDDDVLIVGGEWVEFSENDVPNEKSPESNEDDFALLPDDTEEQFLELRETVLKYVPAMKTDKRDTRRPKSIKAFVDKHSLKVVNEAVIALIDTTITGNGEAGFLFSTHSIYYKASFEKIVKIPYSDIDYGKCVLMHDKKGKPAGLKIPVKGTSVITVENASIVYDAFLGMLIEIGKLTKYAPTDSPKSIVDMDYSIKLPYMKLLVNFMTNSNHSCAELFRLAWDIGLSEAEITELYQYTSVSKERDVDILSQINDNAPYASRKSLRYALILDMFSQLQLITHTSDVAALEHEFIQKIANAYGFSGKDVSDLKKVAQTKYDILTGKIKSVKELEFFQKALTSVAMSAGVPLVTVIGSNLLFWNTLWFWFIPGIGTIIGAALGGFGVAAAIINKNKSDAKFKEQAKEMKAKEIDSYRQAVDKMSQFGYIGQRPAFIKEKAILKENWKLLTL